MPSSSAILAALLLGKASKNATMSCSCCISSLCLPCPGTDELQTKQETWMPSFVNHTLLTLADHCRELLRYQQPLHQLQMLAAILKNCKLLHLPGLLSAYCSYSQLHVRDCLCCQERLLSRKSGPALWYQFCMPALMHCMNSKLRKNEAMWERRGASGA